MNNCIDNTTWLKTFFNTTLHVRRLTLTTYIN